MGNANVTDYGCVAKTQEGGKVGFLPACPFTFHIAPPIRSSGVTIKLTPTYLTLSVYHHNFLLTTLGKLELHVVDI